MVPPAPGMPPGSSRSLVTARVWAQPAGGDLCGPGGLGPRRQSPALDNGRQSGWPVAFTHFPGCVWLRHSLNLTGFAGHLQLGGVWTAPLGPQACGPIVCLHMCGAGPGCQEGRHSVRLCGLSYQLCLEVVTKQMGQAEALQLLGVLGPVLGRPPCRHGPMGAMRPGCRSKAPRS